MSEQLRECVRRAENAYGVRFTARDDGTYGLNLVSGQVVVSEATDNVFMVRWSVVNSTNTVVETWPAADLADELGDIIWAIRSMEADRIAKIYLRLAIGYRPPYMTCADGTLGFQVEHGEVVIGPDDGTGSQRPVSWRLHGESGKAYADPPDIVDTVTRFVRDIVKREAQRCPEPERLTPRIYRRWDDD